MRSATRSLDDLSHGEFDAHLLRTWSKVEGHPYPWQQENLEGHEITHFTVDDYMDWTSAKLVPSIAKIAKMDEAYVAQRAVTKFFVFEVLSRSVTMNHQRFSSPQDLAKVVWEECMNCIGHKHLLTMQPDSPLWNEKNSYKLDVNGKRLLPSQEDNALYSVIDMHYGRDIKIMSALTGVHPDQFKTDEDRNHVMTNRWSSIRQIENLLGEHTPFLATLDRTHITVRQEEWRKNMQELLSRLLNKHSLHEAPQLRDLSSEEQSDMYHSTLDALEDEMPKYPLQEATESFAEEQFIPRRIEELGSASDAQLRSMLGSLKAVRVDGTPDQKRKRIAEMEFAKAKKEGSLDLPNFEDPEDFSDLPEFIQGNIATLFTPHLRKDATESDNRYLKQRLLALDYYLATGFLLLKDMEQEGATEGDAYTNLHGALEHTVETYWKTMEQTQTHWRQHPSFAFAAFLGASQMNVIDVDHLQKFT